MRWADTGGSPLITSSHTFTPSPAKRVIFHSAAQIKRWREDDIAWWKRGRKKGLNSLTYQQ